MIMQWPWKHINWYFREQIQAKPILEKGKFKELVDPNLADNYDESQMQRMVLAATVCLARAPQLRPNMAQVSSTNISH